MNERIGVRLHEGEERTALLAERKDFLRQHLELDQGPALERVLKAPDTEGSRVAVLRCQRRLPNSAKMSLIWGAGVSAPSGVATTERQGQGKDLLQMHQRDPPGLFLTQGSAATTARPRGTSITMVSHPDGIPFEIHLH